MKATQLFFAALCLVLASYSLGFAADAPPGDEVDSGNRDQQERIGLWDSNEYKVIEKCGLSTCRSEAIVHCRSDADVCRPCWRHAIEYVLAPYVITRLLSAKIE